MEIDHFLAASLYDPPPPIETGALPNPLDSPLIEPMFAHLGLDPANALKSPKVIIDELFETPELRMLLYRECVEWGTPVNMELGGTTFVMSVLWLSAIWKLMIGGTHTLAHAMTQACLREGVTFLESAEVSRILLDDGRAVGVQTRGRTHVQRAPRGRLERGRSPDALDLVGASTSPSCRASTSSTSGTGRATCSPRPPGALTEAPHYRSAEVNPEIDRCFYTVVGFEDPGPRCSTTSGRPTAATSPSARRGDVGELPALTPARRRPG